ncbi:hypothetical protein ACEQPO_31165 [Bacillus sp. SL00103]
MPLNAPLTATLSPYGGDLGFVIQKSKKASQPYTYRKLKNFSQMNGQKNRLRPKTGMPLFNSKEKLDGRSFV